MHYSIWKKTLLFTLLISSISTLNAQLTDECKLDFGTNVSGLADWGTELPFIDVMHNARTWYTKDVGNPNAPFDSQHIGELTLRPDGYPTHLPQEIASSEYEQRVATIWAITDGWTAGQYTILWEGTGTFDFWGSYENLQQTSANRIVFDVPNPIGGQIEMRILTSDINDPIHNIRVLMPGAEATYETQPFNPDWLDKVLIFKEIRFMDWAKTNNWGQDQPWNWQSISLYDWADRAQMNHYTWATDKGIPYEMMVKLMNDYDVDGWVCVPHRASDDYMAQMAAYFRDNLEPERHLTIEYSNEIWNWIFGQAQWLNEYGCVQQGLDWPEGTVPYIQNCLDHFTTAFEGQMHRITRAVGVHTAWQDVSNRIVNNLTPGSFDVVSPTYYFGLSEEADAILDDLGADATVADIAYYARQNMVQTLIWIQSQKELADTHNVPLKFYEGGQHITPQPFGEEPTYAQALLDIQRDTAMYNLYQEWFDDLRTLQEGEEPLKLMNFSFIAQRSARYGSWGLFETTTQDTSEIYAPKYSATLANMPPESCQMVGLFEPNLAPIDFEISPNPAVGEVQINVPETMEKGRIEVFNMLGIKVLDYSFENTFDEAILLNINDLASGIYSVQLSSSSQKSIGKRLIIAR